jgi:hypothetical protein
MERLLPYAGPGGWMIRITVKYDTVSQTFKLLGLNLDTLAEGDALLDMNLPLDDAESADDLAVMNTAFAAHA